MGFRRVYGIIFVVLVMLIPRGFTQSVYAANLADVRKLLELVDKRPYLEAIEIDALAEINKIFKLPDQARVMLTRYQYFHVERADTEYFIKLPNPGQNAKPLKEELFVSIIFRLEPKILEHSPEDFNEVEMGECLGR